VSKLANAPSTFNRQSVGGFEELQRTAMKAAERYHPDKEQRALISEATAPLAQLLPLSRLHRSNCESDDTWTAVETLGLLGNITGHEEGESGLGVIEEALIAFEMGGRLIAPSILATFAVAHLSTAHLNIGGKRGCRVAAGYQREGRILRIDEPGAGFLLLRKESHAELHLSPTSSSLDDRQWLADLHEVSGLRDPVTLLEGREFYRLRLLDAAALAGMAEAALQMSVTYASLREQFGRAIGSFQAVQHHCANMVIRARMARDQAGFASIALSDFRRDAELQVECAFLTAGKSALRNAEINIQLHGGTGFSDEADPHLILKRAHLYVSLGGGLERAAARIADLRHVWD
jgi:hypothetical protein